MGLCVTDCDLLSGCLHAESLLALSQFEQIDGVKKGAAMAESERAEAASLGSFPLSFC